MLASRSLSISSNWLVLPLLQQVSLRLFLRLLLLLLQLSLLLYRIRRILKHLHSELSRVLLLQLIDPIYKIIHTKYFTFLFLENAVISLLSQLAFVLDLIKSSLLNYAQVY